ncbi:hypothetical protein E2C01_093920 [Portunus trituberculatus]|uniref:Uncharacterized protein n=1 Tax=Portunus trituberculatus TaxID=210409 RepID=A0A5B7JVI6_PORTR|nr:hypothetical protein [Portunus trituberculatus]
MVPLPVPPSTQPERHSPCSQAPQPPATTSLGPSFPHGTHSPPRHHWGQTGANMMGRKGGKVSEMQLLIKPSLSEFSCVRSVEGHFLAFFLIFFVSSFLLFFVVSLHVFFSLSPSSLLPLIMFVLFLTPFVP